MLELSTIGFKTDTSELDLAAKKIAALGTAVQGLTTTIAKLDKESSKANKTQAEANLINAKAAETTAKAEEKLANAKIKSTKATEEATDSTKQNLSVLERQQMILEFMTQGFSKGQSSTLAYAKATGALTGDLKALGDVLQSQRTLIGGDTFDKSLGALKSLQNEFKVLKEVQRLYTAEIPLTQKQMENLALDKLRLIEAMKIEGKSMTDVKNAIRSLNAEYIGLAGSINKATAADNAIVKSKQDTARANEYLEKELQKVRFALEGTNAELNRGTANSLVRFENALKKSGLTVDEQRIKLDEYRKAQLALQKTSAGRNTDYISRAVGPQITDIMVGLMTGQAPLTVMLQQGGQLRDQFALAGVAAKDMGDVMRKSMATMVSSVVATGGAIVTMLAGGFVDAGKAVTKYMMDFTGVTGMAEAQMRRFAAEGESGFAKIAKLQRDMEVTSKLMATALAASLVTLVAFGIAMYKNVKLTTELGAAVITTGAAYGYSKDQLLGYADSMAKAGVTTFDTMSALTLMIKAGAGSTETLIAITKAAIDLEKYGGQAVKDTAKQYEKLKDDPVKALSELRLNTGLITEATMQHVASLVEQGREVDAVTEAEKAMAEAHSTMAVQLRDELNGIQQLWIDVKEATTGAWQAVIDLTNSTGILTAFRVVWESIKLVIGDVFKSIKGVATGVVAILNGDFKGAANIFSEAWASMGEDYEQAIARTTKTMEGNLQVQDQVTAAKKAEVEQEKARLELAKVMKPFKEAEEKALAKNLDKQSFINAEVARANKGLAQGNQLQAENLALVTKIAAAEWDAANKKKKTPVDKEAKELEGYTKKTLERIKDLGIEISGVTNELTKAEKLMLDLADDPLWNKLTPELKEQIKLELTKLGIQEKVNKEKEKEKKLVEELIKISQANNEFILKAQEQNQKTNDSYDLRLAVLGKTAEEIKKIRAQAELNNKLTESDLKFEHQKLKLKQDFLKLARAEPENETRLYFEYMNGVAKVDKEQSDTRKNLNKEVAVQAAEDFYSEMKAISAPISEAIATALFEGGQAGAKSLRDYLVKTLRNKITLQIDAAVTSFLTGGGGSGSAGGIASGASNLLGNMGSVGASLMAGSTGVSAGWGATVGSFGSATGVAIEGGLAMVAEGTSTAIMGGLGQIAGAIAPWAIAAYGLYSLLKGGEYVKSTGSSVQYFDNQGKTTSDSALSGNMTDEGSSKYVQGIKDSYTLLAKQIGATNVGGMFAYAQNNSDGGKFGVQANVGGIDYQSGEQKTSPEALKLEAARAVLTALKGSELPKYLEGVFDGLTTSTATEDQITNVIKIATELKQFNDVLNTLPFENLKDQTYSTLNALAEFSGGLNQLAGNLGGFYDNFFTETEKQARNVEILTGKFSELGIVMPEVNEEMRKWYKTEVERKLALDQSIPANAKATAEILSLQQAVNDLAPAFNEVTVAVTAAADAQRANIDAWTAGQVLIFNRDQAEEKRILDIQSSARSAVNSIRNQAANNYFNAQKETIRAQENLANVLKGTVDSFKDFISTLDGGLKPTDKLIVARQNFQDLTAKARSGDTEAIGKLTTAARTYLDLSKSYSGTIQAYREDEANVRNVLNEGIKAAETQLKKLPVEMQASLDPIKSAQEQLKLALESETTARTIAIAVQAELTTSETSLVDKYKTAIVQMDTSGQANVDYANNVINLNDILKTLGLTLTSADGKSIIFGDSTTDLTELSDTLGITLKTVDGKQGILKTTSENLTALLDSLGITIGEVDGKQVLLQTGTTTLTKILSDLGISVETTEDKQVNLQTALGDTVDSFDDLIESVTSVQTKQDLLKTATGTTTTKLDTLTTSLVTGVTKQDLLNTATGTTTTNLSTLGTTVNTVNGNQLLLGTATSGLTTATNSMTTAMNSVTSSLPSSSFFDGIKTSMNSALSSAQSSATAAAAYLANLQTQVIPTVSPNPTPTATPVVDTLLGTKGVSMFGGTVTKNWDDLSNTYSAAELADMMNQYSDMFGGAGAAQARAIELGATDAIITELRKYSDGLPRFDGGTNRIPQDMDVRVHKDEAIIPAKFNPATFGNSGMSEQLLNAIANKLTEMQKVQTNENIEIIVNTKKIAQRLDRLSPDGDALNVSVVRTV